MLSLYLPNHRPSLIIYSVLTEMDDKQYPRNWKRKQTGLPRSSTPFSCDLEVGRTKHNVKLKSLARVNKNTGLSKVSGSNTTPAYAPFEKMSHDSMLMKSSKFN